MELRMSGSKGIFISGIFINTGVIFTCVVKTKVNLIKFVRLWDMIKYRGKSSR